MCRCLVLRVVVRVFTKAFEFALRSMLDEVARTGAPADKRHWRIYVAKWVDEFFEDHSVQATLARLTV